MKSQQAEWNLRVLRLTCLMILFLFYRRVLRKLDLDLSDDVIRALANTTNPKPRVIEKVLMLLRMQIDKFLERQGRSRREIDLSLALDKDLVSVKDSSDKSKSNFRRTRL
jgi:hypothetical protein